MNTIIILVLGLIIIWMLFRISSRFRLKKPTLPLDEGRLFWQYYIRGSKAGVSRKFKKGKS